MNKSIKNKIMIVDDDANNRLLLETTLVNAGYEVASYSNGYELLAALAGKHPDAIVTDINMPEIDGFDLLKKIKKLTGSRVPVIFLTARFSDIESRIKGYEFGAHDYITIPYDNNELKARIQNVIINNKYYSENQRKDILINNLIKMSVNIFYSISPDGIIDFFSPQAEKLLGPKAMKTCRWEDFTTDNPVNIIGLQKMYDALKTGKSPQPYELALFDTNDQEIWVELTESPLIENDTVAAITGSLNDITEKKLFQKDLSFKNQRYKLAMDASNYGIFDLNLVTNEVYFSPGWKNMIGYRPEEFPDLVSAFVERIDEESYSKCIKMKNAAIDDTKKRFSFEIRIKHKNGRWIDTLVQAKSFIPEGSSDLRLIGTHTDISMQKLTEKKLRKNHLQLTKLSHHLQNAREEQSAYIAREIHDDLGQELTALEMLLTLFEDELERQNVNDHKIIGIKKELRHQLNSVVEKSRKLVLDLRPAIMDTYKLIGSINWLTDQIRNRFKINIEKDFTPEEIDLGDEKNLAVFRIIQEAFNNITKHSNARNVKITISNDENALNIIIKDDGIGFEKHKIEKITSFGLMSMQERAIYCGGDMKITSKKGHGALLEFIIPKKEIK